MTRVIVFSLLLSLACGGRARPHPRIAISNAQVGECVDPENAGVVSRSPKIKRAPQDLNSDGHAELVVADKNKCRHGNCYWNVFSVAGTCNRYLGTVAGATLEVIDEHQGDGLSGIRAWWKLGGDRHLVQVYAFRHGGYVLVEALLCRQVEGSRLECASEDPAPKL